MIVAVIQRLPNQHSSQCLSRRIAVWIFLFLIFRIDGPLKGEERNFRLPIPRSNHTVRAARQNIVTHLTRDLTFCEEIIFL